MGGDGLQLSTIYAYIPYCSITERERKCRVSESVFSAYPTLVSKCFNDMTFISGDML